MLAGVAVLVLVAAWVSPAVIRPTIDPSYGGGLDVVGGQAVTWRSVEVHSWIGARVERVGDVPGAHVAGAWLVDADDWLPPDRPSPTTADDHEDATSYLEAVVGADRLAGLGLPRRTDAGTEQYLVVLWDVDCDTLVGPATDTVPVRLSTVPGFVRVVDMEIFGLEAGLLADDGAC